MTKIKLSAEELNMIQALRSQKALEESAAIANSNNGANNQKVAEDKPKRKYTPHPLFVVLRKARKLFSTQVTKDVESKKQCIQISLESFDDLYPDRLRFELDFRAERDRLTDSKKFCDACHAIGMDPKCVADHTVFEGRSLVEAVLRYGIQTLGERIRMFSEPLWEDTMNLYPEETEQESAQQQNVEPLQEGSNE